MKNLIRRGLGRPGFNGIGKNRMVRHHFERVIEAPRAEVFRTFRDRQVEINESLPNIKNCRVVENRPDGDCRKSIVVELKGRGLIPFLLQPVLSADQLVWRSHQKWDEENWLCDFYTETRHYTDAVDVRGRWTFEEENPGSTRIVIRSRIEIDAGLVPEMPEQIAKPVSSLVERLLHAMTEPNLNKICRRAAAIAGNSGAAHRREK